MLVEVRLDSADQLLERLAHAVGCAGGEALVDAGELDEGDRRLAVLAVVASVDDVLTQRPAQGYPDVEPRLNDRLAPRRAQLRVGRPGQQPPGFDRGARAPLPGPRERVRRRVADHDLPRPRDLFHPRQYGRRGPGHDQLPVVGAADQEEVGGAAVDADRHSQADRATARPQGPDATHRALHLPGAPAGSQHVPGTVEQQRRRVAAPLDQAGAIVVGGVEQCRERGVDQVGHLLGADLPAGAEQLRHAGEARHIREHERAVELLVALFGPVAQPVLDERRHVRDEPIRATVGHGPVLDATGAQAGARLTT